MYSMLEKSGIGRMGEVLRKILYIDRVIGEGEVKLFQHVVFFFESFSFQELNPFTFILFP